jgi:hypothetical protein
MTDETETESERDPRGPSAPQSSPAPQAPATADAHPAEPLAMAWAQLEESWDDDGAHRRFIALCMARGDLQAAGKLYRSVRERDPSRAAEAGKRIDAIVVHALTALDVARAERPKKRLRIEWIAYGLSVFFVLYTLLSILRARPR